MPFDYIKGRLQVFGLQIHSRWIIFQCFGFFNQERNKYFFVVVSVVN